jgi:hypothetical protein
MGDPNPQVECKLGTIVPTIRLCEQTEFAVLVHGELCIECLQKLPHEWSSGDRRGRVVGAEAEAGINGLVYVKHVGEIIPTMRVQQGS